MFTWTFSHKELWAKKKNLPSQAFVFRALQVVALESCFAPLMAN